ncbi:MAG: transglycosylase domain-containing protein, partial [Mycobacteriales bacterium]
AVRRGPQDRVAVSLTSVPIVMRQAIVAIEDDRFYEHAGLDLRGILRAALRNTQAGTITQGGSTLTQQYVKNVLIQQEGFTAATADTVTRKLQEARYAVALEARLTKAQILERYLNIAYFGEGVYGVGTAASHYFAEPVTALTLPQSALLAGLVEDPTGYDPVLHPKLSLERRNTVLARMGQLHYISARAAQAAERTPLRVHPQIHSVDPCVGSIAPFFCSAVLAQLLSDPALGATQAERDNAVFEGGLDITTTLDPQVEMAAQQAVDSVVPRNNRAVDPIAMVKPGTGAVLALAVNRTYGDARPGTTDTKFPLVTQPFAQPGSSFKLFTLVAALEQGVPLSLTLYAPPCYISKVFSNPVGGGSFCPLGYRNADPTEAGTFALPQATWYSVNTYFVQLEERVGLAPIRVAATELGIPPVLVANTGG